MKKDEDYRRLIHTERWLRLRKWKLTAQPLCERCLEEGLYTPATEVHHAVPVEDALTRREKEALMFDPGNLVSLCHACHVKEHEEMGRSGKELARRRNGRQTERAIRKFFDETPGGDFFKGGGPR